MYFFRGKTYWKSLTIYSKYSNLKLHICNDFYARSLLSLYAHLLVHPNMAAPAETTAVLAGPQLTTKRISFIRNLAQSCTSLPNRPSVPKVHCLSSNQCGNKLHPSLSDCVNTTLLRDSFIPQKILSNRREHSSTIIKPVDFNFRSVILLKWIRLSRCLHHQLKLM